MADGLHIERPGSSIQLDEWVTAVESIDGARINGDDSEFKNPKTGQVIEIPGNPGNVEVRVSQRPKMLAFGKQEEWTRCIRFGGGKGSFNAGKDIEAANSPIRRVAAELAAKLSARIVGDEGENYDW